jgi:hypothetical protein
MNLEELKRDIKEQRGGERNLTLVILPRPHYFKGVLQLERPRVGTQLESLEPRFDEMDLQRHYPNEESNAGLFSDD